ncbi:MAG: DUF4295 family protein [Candidatus Neomarinimicrobiota bacterium]
MAKKVGGFAAKSAKAREKRNYSLAKYVRSVRSTKTGMWRFQEEIVKVMDGEDISAAIKRFEAELHPMAETIPVIQPEELIGEPRIVAAAEVAEAPAVVAAEVTAATVEVAEADKSE